MTEEERAVIEAAPAAQDKQLRWAPHETEGFVRLLGDPACPFLGIASDGRPGCQIRELRPYNCRRWGCFRKTIDEPYDVIAVKERIISDRSIRRQAVQLQRKSQRWARKHGWKEA